MSACLPGPSLGVPLQDLFGNRFADLRHFFAELGDQVVKGDDTESRVKAVDDRHPPDVIGVHQRRQLMQVLIDGYADRVGRHDLFDNRLVGIAFGAGDPERDIAIGQDTAKLAVALGDQAADVVLLHQLTSLGDIGLR